MRHPASDCGDEARTARLLQDSVDDLAGMPGVLRALLDAELAAGNQILEVGHSFPAPPVGAYFLLAKPVTSRARASGDGIVFYGRNTLSYSGEFTDERRHFFILEAPLPPPMQPETDAIRSAQRDASASPAPPLRNADTTPPQNVSTQPASTSALRRFQESMVIDYEKWHDGIGYDLHVLQEATDAERDAIEAMLLRRGAADWRDVEALAALDTPQARRMLAHAMKHGGAEIRAAVIRYAPRCISDGQREAALIAAIQAACPFSGLSATLDEVVQFHPPPVCDALLRGAFQREGDVAVHLAAMAAFVFGKTAEPFDWAHRPLFLRFKDDDVKHRESAFRALCAWLEIDPEPYFTAE